MKTHVPPTTKSAEHYLFDLVVTVFAKFDFFGLFEFHEKCVFSRKNNTPQVCKQCISMITNDIIVLRKDLRGVETAMTCPENLKANVRCIMVIHVFEKCHFWLPG